MTTFQLKILLRAAPEYVAKEAERSPLFQRAQKLGLIEKSPAEISPAMPDIEEETELAILQKQEQRMSNEAARVGAMSPGEKARMQRHCHPNREDGLRLPDQSAEAACSGICSRVCPERG